MNFDEISAEDIFPIESKWKDRSLLYSTIQAYAAATGWKATLSHSIYIQCSCYKRPTRRETSRKFTSGLLCKDCDWEIKVRSSQNKTRRINSGISEGKYKSFPVVADGVSVIISKANLTHTGQCSPSRLQQILKRSRSGAYVKNMSDAKTKDGFDEGYKSALELLQNRDQRYRNNERSLHEFAEQKDSYASYILW